MAKGNRLTITVTPHGNHQSVSIRSTGTMGSVNVNTTTVDKAGVPLITGLTSNAYWNAVLASIAGYIPAT